MKRQKGYEKETREKSQKSNYLTSQIFSFSHPDFTVGFGISPNQHLAIRLNAHGLRANAHHRRSGITPCPEGKLIKLVTI
jgi:hypothetical protein